MRSRADRLNSTEEPIGLKAESGAT